jgi:hypothetical protein
MAIGSDPPYLPAGDAWLACAYHDYIQQTRAGASAVELDSEEFLKGVEAIVQQGRELAAKVAAADFTTFPTAKRNIPYYKSALLEVLGDITSILADYSTNAKREQYLREGEKYLTQCLQENDLPSPLLRNSLADVSRQLGRYIEAHQQLDEAFLNSPAPDPALYHTRAMIFWEQGLPLKGLFALEQYDESKVKEDAAQDAEQYVENQILAAQLAAAVDCGAGDQYVAIAADILEAARRFLDKRAAILSPELAQDLRTRIDELLGFAYLQVPGHESRAVDAFDLLSVAGGVKAPPEISWRRRLGQAKALTRLARSQRRNFSSQVAAQQCDRANAQLAKSSETIKQFGLDSAPPVAARRRRALLHLDTAVAIQALAEESFCEGKLKPAQDMLEQNNDILASLRGALGSDSSLRRELGAQLTTVNARLRLLEAQRCFLLGRIALRSDPSFSGSGLLDQVEANFNAARGVDSDLECRIDLEFGELLLAAAMAKKGDVKMLYRRSLTALEAAAGRDAPALRAETMRALADAYSRSAAVARIANESSKSG